MSPPPPISLQPQATNHINPPDDGAILEVRVVADCRRNVLSVRKAVGVKPQNLLRHQEPCPFTIASKGLGLLLHPPVA